MVELTAKVVPNPSGSILQTPAPVEAINMMPANGPSMKGSVAVATVHSKKKIVMNGSAALMTIRTLSERIRMALKKKRKEERIQKLWKQHRNEQMLKRKVPRTQPVSTEYLMIKMKIQRIANTAMVVIFAHALVGITDYLMVTAIKRLRITAKHINEMVTPTFLQRKRRRSMLIEQMKVLLERRGMMINDERERKPAPFDLPMHIQWMRVHLRRLNQMLVRARGQ